MLLILSLLIFSLSVIFLLFKVGILGKHKNKSQPAESTSRLSQAARSQNRGATLEEIKAQLEISPKDSLEDTAIFRFVGTTNILEMLLHLQILNNSKYGLTIYKITWDFWIEGLHIKYGTFLEKIYTDPKNPKQSICLHEVLLDSQTTDVLWASQKANSTGYLEGAVYCETVYGRFQKKFSLLKLRFNISGEAKEKPRNAMGEDYLDGLTGLLQRKFLDDNLQTIIDRNIHRAPISFAMLDIDHFKKINDECGHLAGDEVLKYVCSVIKETLRDRGIAIRYGGDEIAIVLPNCNVDEAQAIMETIRATVEKHDLNMQEGIIKTTLSIGVAALTSQANYKLLIRIADNMLRFSKQNGKNRVSVNLRKIETED